MCTEEKKEQFGSNLTRLLEVIAAKLKDDCCDSKGIRL